jgi:hypothetical protein
MIKDQGAEECLFFEVCQSYYWTPVCLLLNRILLFDKGQGLPDMYLAVRAHGPLSAMTYEQSSFTPAIRPQIGVKSFLFFHQFLDPAATASHLRLI